MGINKSRTHNFSFCGNSRFSFDLFSCYFRNLSAADSDICDSTSFTARVHQGPVTDDDFKPRLTHCTLSQLFHLDTGIDADDNNYRKHDDH